MCGKWFVLASMDLLVSPVTPLNSVFPPVFRPNFPPFIPGFRAPNLPLPVPPPPQAGSSFIGHLRPQASPLAPQLTADLGTDPRFSIFTDISYKFFVSELNRFAKRFCMEERRKDAAEQATTGASGTEKNAATSLDGETGFSHAWKTSPKNFVPYVPPAVFCDYRQVALPGFNVFSKVAKADDAMEDRRRKRAKPLPGFVREGADKDEVVEVPREGSKTPELIDLAEPNDHPSEIQIIGSQKTNSNEEDDIQILETPPPEIQPQEIMVDSEFIKTTSHPNDSISAHFAKVKGIRRQWENAELPSGALNKKSVASAKKQGNKKKVLFSLCSYNVLCQSAIGTTMYLYGHCRESDLNWEDRWRRIRGDLQMLDADIFCLQEVEAQHYHADFKPFLESLGYETVFIQRTGTKGDGCAICWRKEKFSLDSWNSVQYKIDGTLLDRDNVGLIVSLVPKVINQSATNQKLIVATTHLLYNPKRGDIKLGQLALLLASLDRAARKKDSSKYPVILCGDFNSEPLSPLYNFVVGGNVKYEGQNQYELSGQGKVGGRVMDKRLIPPQAGVTDSCQYVKEWMKRQESEESDDCLVVDENEADNTSAAGAKVPEGIGAVPKKLPPLCTGSLWHSFHFLSIYRHMTKKGDWEITTLHSRESANVDYIFYSLLDKTSFLRNEQLVVRDVREGDLKCLQRYKLLSQREVRNSVGILPNKYCGSDHLPLMGKFELAV